jgi:hypothetical protein
MEPAMKSPEWKNEIQGRAVEALKSALSSVSSAKLVEVRRPSHAKLGRLGFLAYVIVFGRTHTLACHIRESVESVNLDAALGRFRERAGGATPVLIAPYLSFKAQSICKKCNAAFLDLEGNARIVLGEIFIGRRSIPARAPEHFTLDAGLRYRAETGRSNPAPCIANIVPALKSSTASSLAHTAAVV